MPFWIVGGDGYRFGVGPFETAEQAACNLSSNPAKAMLAIAGGQALIRFREAPAKAHRLDIKTTGNGCSALHVKTTDYAQQVRQPAKQDVASKSPRSEPCPPEAERRSLKEWAAEGWVIQPQPLSPSAIAAAYVRHFGVQPFRQPPRRAVTAYSHRELRHVLQTMNRRLELLF